jgi:hypothetical protein
MVVSIIIIIIIIIIISWDVQTMTMKTNFLLLVLFVAQMMA